MSITIILKLLGGVVAPRRVVTAVLGLMLALPLSAALAGDSLLRSSTVADSLSAGELDQQPGVTLVAYTLQNANLRSGPARTYPVIAVVPHSTQVTAMGRDAGAAWIYVDVSGVRGWISRSLLQVEGSVYTLPIVNPSSGPQPTPTPASAPAAGPVTVTTRSTMNLRACASTSCAVVGRVPGGVTLTPTGRSANSQWVFVRYNNVRGYLAAWLLKVSGDLASLPVTNQPGGTVPPPTPTPMLPTATPVPALPFALGGQTHTLDHPDHMRYAGMTWVKFQLKWQPGQPASEITSRIDKARANGFKVLLSITGPEYPSSIDFQAFVGYVAAASAAGADAIEIWNEMNLSREWPVGQISPSSYVNDMLKPAYAAIKQQNPAAIVISGGLAPTGFDDGVTAWSDERYLRGMRDAGAADYMDCLGVHYNAGATSPDAVTGHPADPGAGHYSWYFQPMLNLYYSVFRTEPQCFTEIGYVSGEGYGPLPPMFWWGGDTTVAEQAEWLARAVQIARASGWVRMMVVYNVDFTHWGDDPQAGYAIIRPGGGCPACETLHSIMAGG